ncbi:MAG: glutamate racemase [Clostridiales bacterium]|nr:glutamate racemase [Clostridiales bacterium]
MDKNAPVGVFDSGVGGLTVAREIMRQIPEERIVYFGDTARLPYGSKSKDTVVRYSRQIIRFLRTRDVKAIVIACNTASSYALETVAAETDIPVIGVIVAGAKTAVQATRNGRIGVIGTEGTIGSGIYTEVMRRMRPDIEVFGKACPLFVPLVEEGLLHDSVTDEIASRYLSVLKGKYIDTLVLGCTHYPLLRSTLGRLMGEGVTLVNPAYETALELKALLRERRISRDPEAGRNLPEVPDGSLDEERYQFYVSDLAEKFTDFARSILPNEVKETRKIDIENY